MSTIPALFSVARARSGPSTSARDVESNSSSWHWAAWTTHKEKVTESDKRKKFRSKTSKRKYSKTWEKEFSWLMYDDVLFVVLVRGQGDHCSAQEEWVTKPFQNWKKAVEKMRTHERSESHIQASEALLLATKSGTIAQQLQSIGEQGCNKIPHSVYSFSHSPTYRSFYELHAIRFSSVLWCSGSAELRWK